MIEKLRDFEIELIDEPLQEHVVAWERAARALKTSDAKPHLLAIMDELKGVTVTQTSLPALLQVFQRVAAHMHEAFKIIEENETLTRTANRGLMVKAAISAGWVKAPVVDAAAVDTWPAWRVAWVAEKVAALYDLATEIPKN